MRGYGESQKPSAVSEYTLDKLAVDVKALVKDLGRILLFWCYCFSKSNESEKYGLKYTVARVHTRLMICML